MTPYRDRYLDSRSFGLIFVSVSWALFLTIIGSPEVLLFTVPLFMLAAPLALGRYFGDELIERLSRMARARRRVANDVSWLVRPATGVVRGSRLIALNLAGRAPPVAAA